MAYVARSSSSPFFGAALAILASGCPSPPPSPPLDAGPRPDAPRDGGGPLVDAPTDAPATLGDGGPDLSQCRAMEPEDLVLVDTDTRPMDRRVAIAAAHAEWGVAYMRTETGVPNIFWARVATDTSLIAPGPATMGFSSSKEPAIVATDAGWVLAWVNNASGSNELYARAFGPDGAPLGAAATPLTSNTLDESAPSLVRNGTEVLVGWLESTTDGTSIVLRTRRLSNLAVPLADAVTIDVAGYIPRAPELAQRLDGTLVAWASTDAIVAPLTATGGSGSGALVVSAEGNVSSTMDLALDGGGGAIVFDVQMSGRQEVHGLLLGASGEVIGPERVLTIAPDAGNGASITEFAGGYALSYRATNESPALVRILFLTANLDEAGRIDVGETTAAGGRTTIRASGDGRLLVGWTEGTATRTDVRVARVRCD